MSIRTGLQNVLICGLTPYFLEKPDFWFEENKAKILEAAKTQSFFQDNTCIIQQNQNSNLSQFLRKLDELGYEKVLAVSEPGEFARRGGIIDLFPINFGYAIRIEFYGNLVERIERLPLEIADGEKERQRLIKKIKRQEAFADISKLKPGDYVVHLDHGIAQFAGTEKPQILITNDQSDSQSQIKKPKVKEYYLLEYAQEDKLFVPVELARKLSLYVGFTEPKISRLSSPLWERTKRRVKEETEKLAKELLELYAHREIAARPPYASDETILRQVTSTFPFEETPDQTQSIYDIQSDLSRERPMDRIVCGDVGFGKTEIALRAAVLAATAGRQTALICPTTILAHQHYQTFASRLRNLPIRIAMLSRFQSKSQQKSVIEQLKRGKNEIVIGTHRILSSDVEFCNLGLLIVDDEQRFGVRQKEKLKKMRSSLDVLSLSATPIPRTLYLALSSLRNISIIKTPPPDRLPIKTFILPWSEGIIRRAMAEELKRKGQIYYLHNRIETAESAKQLLKRLALKARIAVAHGKLSEKELISVMENFRNKKIDVLVATTIIENGLDLVNANTLIVGDATRLGLAQAYQIRGRVGRAHQQAFAYFLHGNNLSDMAKERLKALKEAEELGSGWRIALKDLEIRGAGNVLGKEQSGNVNQVGLNLYCQVLSDAVEKLRG